jgi:phosphonate dehydrogenase
MGKLGQAFVKLLSGFSARVLYYDPVALSPVHEAILGAARTSFDQLLAQCDVIVVLAPLTESTLHMINAESLGKMKPGAYLVNVGRGSVVDEQAVAQALASGRLAGYAADVFEMEDWARPDHPASVEPALLDGGHTLFTPHLGSAVKSVRLEIELAAAHSILQVLRGQRPQGAINDPEGAK